MTSEPPKQKAPLYRRPLPIALSLVLVAGIGAAAVAKANNYSVTTSVYVFFAGFNTPKVTLSELEQKQVKPVVLVDVRTAEEYADDHIGKSLLVPLKDIESGQGVQKIQEIAKAYSKPNQPQPTMVLYCSAGPRSIKAYQILKDKNVGIEMKVLAGGLTGWRQTVAPAGDAKVISPIAAPAQSAQNSTSGKL